MGGTWLTLRRANQRQQWPPALRRLVSQCRQIIETVTSQVAAQCHRQVNHAHTFWGLQTRLDAKVAAHTLCLYLHRLHGVETWLQIKPFALAS